MALPTMGQAFGTPDLDFFGTGREVYNFPADKDFMLTFLDHRYFPEDQTSLILIGGNMSVDFLHDGALFSLVTRGPGSLRISSRMGDLTGDLNALYEGIITPDRRLLVAGYDNSIPAQRQALIARFLELDLNDRSFGVNGVQTVGSQNETEEVGGFYLDESRPESPEIYLTGYTQPAGSSNTEPAIWKFDYAGSPVSSFGTNGRLICPNEDNWSAFWHASAYNNQIVGIGQSDDRAFYGIYNYQTNQWKNYYHPSRPITNIVYDATGALQREESMLICGLTYNLATDEGGGWLQCFDDLTGNPLVTNPDKNAIMEQSLATLEEENRCTITGIFKTANWYVPVGQPLKGSQPDGGYILTGTIEYSTGPEQTFLACLTTEGEIYRGFGENGFVVLTMPLGSWPIDMVYTEDSKIYVGVNGGDRYAYLYCLNGYRDLSGISETEKEWLSMTLYPNPVEQELFLNVGAPKQQPAILTVNNMLGQVVYHDRITLQPGTNRLSLDPADWASGTYFVRLAAGDEVINQRFVRK